MSNIYGFLPKENFKNANFLVSLSEKIEVKNGCKNLFLNDNQFLIGATSFNSVGSNRIVAPVEDEKAGLCVAFTGAIYNHSSLVDDLKEKGYSFDENSESSVVLNLFKEYGKDCVNKIKGTFAFAAYDYKTAKLFLARDKTGTKPLYYIQTNQCFMFSSDLKSIMVTELIEKSINKIALAQYISLSYIPAPLTILDGVYKLKPASSIEVKSGVATQPQEYWDLKYSDSDKIDVYETCKQELRTTLFNAVEDCMPKKSVATFLSGGIDSTIITGIASQLYSGKVDTFSIAFAQKQYDESDRALLTATKFNTNHHVLTIDYNNLLEDSSVILDNIDEPFADSSYIATYEVSKFASSSNNIVLTGDAGDELFAGYDKYLIGYYSNLYNKVPKLLRKGIFEKLVYSLPDRTSISRKVRKVIDYSQDDVFTQHRNLMCLGVKYNQLPQILNFDFEGSHDFIKYYYDKYEGVSCEIDRTLYTDFKTELEGDMLYKVESAGRIVDLSTRAPMLHPDVFELSAKIPAKFKINLRDRKIILKDTFSDIIPSKLLNAPKRGFGVPVASWFRNELCQDLINTLNKEKIEAQQLFDYEFVEKLLKEHISGERNNSGALWALYVFEKWYDNYFA